MNWSEIILSVVSVILTALATWGVGKLTAWLNIKIKDKTALKYINDALEVVKTVVKATYQTYVEAIKGGALWNKETQEKALNDALNCAKSQLSAEAKKYISENFGNLDTYLINQIESAIYDLKK